MSRHALRPIVAIAVAAALACDAGPSTSGVDGSEVTYRLVLMDQAALPVEPFGDGVAETATYLDSATLRVRGDSAALRSHWRQVEYGRTVREPETIVRAGVSTDGERVVLRYANPGTVLPESDTGRMTGGALELRSRAYGREQVRALVFERAAR